MCRSGENSVNNFLILVVSRISRSLNIERFVANELSLLDIDFKRSLQLHELSAKFVDFPSPVMVKK